MKHMSALKQRLAGLALSLGYTIIPTWKIESSRNAAYLRRLFEFLNIDCVIDVGANAGQYHEFLREDVGFRGLVASFEPVPRLAEDLQRAARAEPNWLVEHCALGARPGELDFHVMKNTEFSSFLSPLTDKTASFDGANTVVETVSVAVRMLDDIIPKLRTDHGAKNIYLKLDTQGFDLEVLKGAAHTLETISALQSEMCVRPIYDGMPKFGQVIDYLEQRGFQMSGIFPNNAGHFPMLLEFDCYMYRPKA